MSDILELTEEDAAPADGVALLNAVVALVRRARTEALEEAATIAETCPHADGWYTQGDRRRAEAIAAAIRALKADAPADVVMGR